MPGVGPTPKALSSVSSGQGKKFCKELLPQLLSTSPVLSSCVTLGKCLYLSEPLSQGTNSAKNVFLVGNESFMKLDFQKQGKTSRGEGDSVVNFRNGHRQKSR